MNSSVDSQRLFLYMGLLFLCLLIYQAWVVDYGPRPTTETATGVTDTSVATGVADNNQINRSNAESSLTDLPAGNSQIDPATQASTAADASSVASSDTQNPAETRITVTTDFTKVTISSVGGTILGVDLLNYPVSLEQPDTAFSLASDQVNRFLVAQSGFLAVDGGEAPTHKTAYTAESDTYDLGDGDSVVVPLVWESADGVRVTKTLTFTRSSYDIGVNYQVENNAETPWRVNQYQQLQRKPVTSDETSRFLYTYIGGVVSTPEERYTKAKFEKFSKEPLSVDSQGGYVAMIQHYFAAAWIPDQQERNNFYTKYVQNTNRYLIGMISGIREVAPGSQATFTTNAYIGPKVQDELAKSAPHLELTVDYGWLHILAQPLFRILKFIHGLIGNWGWSIIILTLMIKAVFYKLSKASYTSMARMKKLQPKLQSLKERYGDDRSKMGQETMALYKKEKVNPLGGCLPMIVQIPVFIALYWMLLESVELRQAPWALWIKDLSIKDPFFILPLLMGLTMFIQQKLNPAPVDPIQAKVFMVLPVVFTVFFAWFPAGLVLYWVVNNTLSIAQQYYITRHVLGNK